MLLLFSRSVMSDCWWSYGLPHTGFPCTSLSSGICSNSTSIESVMPYNHLIILCCSLLLLPSIFSSSGSLLVSQYFPSGGQSIGISASASVLPMNIQDWFPLGLTGESPCSPRDFEESYPTPQFKSINSLVLSFLYSPTLTSIGLLKKP